MSALAPTPTRFHWQRRSVQVITLLLVIIVPASGLFRIDPKAGALVILHRQVWFADFFLIAGLWVSLVSLLVMLYSLAGTVFCGWVCPQNIFSEWANFMTHLLLGKRAEVNLDGQAPVIAPAKNRAINWILLGLSFLLASMFLGVIPLFYFYDPGTVLSFILWRSDPVLAQSLHWIYAVFVLIILVDIAVIRHFWCRFACVYRVWQHSFRTRETLHVRYDDSRASACEKCNYCVTSCFIEIDPRKTNVYDSCINCGECIDACNRLQGKKGLPGLLSFEIGENQQKKVERIQFRNNAFGLKTRATWMSVILLLGISLFTWGLWTWKPLHLSAYRAETQESSRVALNYRIEIANKRYQTEVVTLGLKGLHDGEYHFSQTQLIIPPADRRSVTLSVSPNLSHGLHYFIIDATAPDVGWKDHFSIRHFSESATRSSP